jgi:hypothetical protein
MKTINGAVAIIAIALSGCSTTSVELFKPTGAKVETEHVSHLMAGWPFKPEWRDENGFKEGGLSHVQLLLQWENEERGYYLESGLGYKLDTQGLIGPRMSTSVRFGKAWKFK